MIGDEKLHFVVAMFLFVMGVGVVLMQLELAVSA